MSNTDPTELTSIPLSEIEAARERIKGYVVRTPLVKLNCDYPGTEIYIKLENLQDIGAFKQRCAANALLCMPEEVLADGVYCPSAGNFGLGVTYMAQRLGVNSTIIVPDTAPNTKLNAIKRYGGKIVKLPWDNWWHTMKSRHYEGIPGQMVHPVCNTNGLAGNGTIGLEILEDLPDVDIILTPYGGGGLAIGVASAVKAIRPEVRVVACEVDTAAPLTYSREMGGPSVLLNHKTSFVDGMGGKTIFPDMWNLAQNLIDDTAIVNVKQISDAIRLLLERNRILAEGAGAASVAAALSQNYSGKKVVAVISGGNLDFTKLYEILQDCSEYRYQVQEGVASICNGQVDIIIRDSTVVATATPAPMASALPPVVTG